MSKSDHQSALGAAFFLDAGAILSVIFAFWHGFTAFVHPLLIVPSLQYLVAGILSAAMLSGFAAHLRMSRESLIELRIIRGFVQKEVIEKDGKQIYS